MNTLKEKKALAWENAPMVENSSDEKNLFNMSFDAGVLAERERVQSLIDQYHNGDISLNYLLEHITDPNTIAYNSSYTKN